MRWPAYYDAVADQPPHSTLVDAATRFQSEGSRERSAVDLGCGSGRDTLELLRRGWRVLSIDVAPYIERKLEAMEAHRTQTPDLNMWRRVRGKIPELMGEEQYIRAFPDPGGPSEPDLFAALR